MLYIVRLLIQNPFVLSVAQFFVVVVAVCFHEDEILKSIICWNHEWTLKLELQLSMNRSYSAVDNRNEGES